MLKQYLEQLVLYSDTKKGKVFDIAIQALIVISLISFSIETLPDLSPFSLKILNHIELVTIIVFTIEYLLRITLSTKKLKFILSFSGLIDLFAILPFYLSSGVDLRSIRIVRLLRIFRILKMFRYTDAISRYKKAFLTIRHELTLFFFTSVFLLYISSVGIYYFEKSAQPEIFKSVFHSFWWAVITLTTVGYGDFYPITVGGRIFTIIILFIGMGVLAVPTGLFASALTKIFEDEKRS